MHEEANHCIACKAEQCVNHCTCEDYCRLQKIEVGADGAKNESTACQCYQAK